MPETKSDQMSRAGYAGPMARKKPLDRIHRGNEHRQGNGTWKAETCRQASDAPRPAD